MNQYRHTLEKDWQTGENDSRGLRCSASSLYTKRVYELGALIELWDNKKDFLCFLFWSYRCILLSFSDFFAFRDGSLHVYDSCLLPMILTTVVEITVVSKEYRSYSMFILSL